MFWQQNILLNPSFKCYKQTSLHNYIETVNRLADDRKNKLFMCRKFKSHVQYINVKMKKMYSSC